MLNIGKHICMYSKWNPFFISMDS